MGFINQRSKKEAATDLISPLQERLDKLEELSDQIRTTYTDDMVRISVDLVHINNKIEELKTTPPEV